ncbi:MAG: ATP-dependent Clp protease ATP-binding subunit [Bacteroidales bacterium]|nr:ATP-dependent Clp protease ATP-binding subunit [Bacteroidales bacterium]
MQINYSEEMNKVLVDAKSIAIQYGFTQVTTEHIFDAILRYPGETGTKLLLSSFSVDTEKMQYELETMFVDNDEESSTLNEPELSIQATNILRRSKLHAQKIFNPLVEPQHFVAALLQETPASSENVVKKMLNQRGVTYNEFLRRLTRDNISGRVSDAGYSLPTGDEEEDEDDRRFNSKRRNIGKKSSTPMLDSFGKDLTRYAEEGKLDVIVGREKELERIAQILSRRKKNNPVLIGEPGVGKSALAEGLALRIKEGRVSRTLMNKRIIALDMTSLVAGTKYRGQFEERMQNIINELEKNPDVILFIDELHTMVGAGSSPGSLDASNMFKPALARGEVQCIGATTLDEYRQYIEKDGALERRFQKIILEPTTPEETIEILKNIKDKYEAHHGVTYTDEALKACVSLSNRYITDRCLPDKAIDALDEAGSRVHILNVHVPPAFVEIEQTISDLQEKKNKAIMDRQYNLAAELRNKVIEAQRQLDLIKAEWKEQNEEERPEVTEEKVAEVIAMMTGVPVQRIAKSESERLLKMADELQGSVIGQDEAILKIAKAIRRNRAGLKDPNKPIGTFIFLGPTGVGKTYLAKVLASYLFDSPDAMVRIDMSEYMEKHTISRLIGAPPGYVGYEEGGQLTEKIRRKPYSIVLLDEVEKAHKDVYNVLLQVFDDGVLTDGMGRKVDFKNTILIMTSNVGSRELKDFGKDVGFSTSATQAGKDKKTQKILETALKNQFPPEFLNRIDDIIFFNNIEEEDVKKIIRLELKKLLGRIGMMGLDVTVTDAATDFLAREGWDANYGARPLKRAIQKNVEDLLAEEILANEGLEGQMMIVDYDEVLEGLVVRKKVPQIENQE